MVLAVSSLCSGVWGMHTSQLVKTATLSPRLPSRPLRVRSSGLACGLTLVNVLTVVPINIIVLNELKHVDWIVIGK